MEVLHLDTGTWSFAAPMTVRRCNFKALVVQQHLWAIGGYSNIDQRTPLIERYDFSLDVWQCIGI